MDKDWLAKDKVLVKAYNIIEKFSKITNINIMSVVLFGSKAKKGASSQSEYEILILIDDNISFLEYTKFCENLKIGLLSEKLYNVKVLNYTVSVFEELLYNDPIIGAFFYIIIKENIILHDKLDTFYKIRERLIHNNLKSENVFLKQCIEFSKMLGSEKWQDKWEKKLMQYKYLNKRRA